MMILLLVLEVGYIGDHDDEEVDEERKKKRFHVTLALDN